MDEKSTSTLDEMLSGFKQRRLAHFIAKHEGLSFEEVFESMNSLSEAEIQKYMTLKEEHDRVQEEKKAEQEADNKAFIEKEKEEAAKRDALIRENYIKNQFKAFIKTLPAHYREATLEKVYKPDSPAWNELVKSLDRDNKSALITGPNGCGKTYLAISLTKHWKSIGETAEYTKSVDVLANIKEHQLENPYRYMQEHYGRNCQHLILDEIDKIRATDADYVYLTYLHDIRYENDLQTIYFGNLKPGQSNKDLVPQSIFSRIKEKGYSLVLDGGDRRLKE